MKKIALLLIICVTNTMIAHAATTPSKDTNTPQTTPSVASSETYNPNLTDDSSTEHDPDPENE